MRERCDLMRGCCDFMTQKCNFMKYDFSHGKMYEIPAKIMHIKKFRLYFMKRAPNGGESAVAEHFFMQIGENMMSKHETRQIGSERKIRFCDPGQKQGIHPSKKEPCLCMTPIFISLLFFQPARSILCQLRIPDRSSFPEDLQTLLQEQHRLQDPPSEDYKRNHTLYSNISVP